jgi:hypothetical protein
VTGKSFEDGTCQRRSSGCAPPYRKQGNYRTWIRTMNNASKGRVIPLGRAYFAIRFSRRSPPLRHSNSSGGSRLTSDIRAWVLFRRITNSPSGPQNPSRPTPGRKALKRAGYSDYNTEIASSPKIACNLHIVPQIVPHRIWPICANSYISTLILRLLKT